MSLSLEQCHSITVDLEDWFHVCGIKPEAFHRAAPRVVEATTLLLDLMRQHQVRGTFFVLGEVAENHPELAPLIRVDGHELASHGWSHALVTELGPVQFRNEIERTADLLESQTGLRPLGFRAPRWSLSRADTPWAFEILAESGYRYDSSLTPLRYIGEPEGSQAPFMIETSSGTLWEIPPMVTPSLLGNLPTGGGWGFRFFPFRMISKTIRRYQLQGMPAVLFVHPRELDPQGPRLELPVFKSFVTYGGRGSSGSRLSKLMAGHSFRPLGELVEQWQSAS